MTSAVTQDILRKINYIEADIEIQKQILFPIPSADKAAMEKTIQDIADKKKEIEALRERIREEDPEGFQQIENFAAAAEAFKKIAAETKFAHIDASDGTNSYVLTLKDQQTVECLVRAQKEDGSWVAITCDGRIQEFSNDELADSQP